MKTRNTRFRIVTAVALLAGLCAGLLTGCGGVETMGEITEIKVIEEAGTILPELRWREETRITTDGVTFTRSGFVEDTQVNCGTWQAVVDRATLDDLLEEINAVDLRAIRRVEPEDEPEGGGTLTLILVDARGRSFEMNYTPGATYQNGDRVLTPVMTFVRELTLPESAIPRVRIDD